MRKTSSAQVKLKFAVNNREGKRPGKKDSGRKTRHTQTSPGFSFQRVNRQGHCQNKECVQNGAPMCDLGEQHDLLTKGWLKNEGMHRLTISSRYSLEVSLFFVVPATITTVHI